MQFSDAAEKWNHRYRQSDGLLFGDAPNDWLAANAHSLPSAANLLCLADGEGRNSTWLAAAGHRVSAFDISSVAIERLNALAAARGVTVAARVASIQDWVDETCSSQAQPHLDAIIAVFIQFADPVLRKRLFAAIAVALKPGGILIIEGYGQRQLDYATGGPRVIENLYESSLMASSFAGWATLASRDTDKLLAEGSAHAGRSHLISAVLRKPVD